MTKGRIIASWIIQVLVAGLFLMMGSQNGREFESLSPGA